VRTDQDYLAWESLRQPRVRQGGLEAALAVQAVRQGDWSCSTSPRIPPSARSRRTESRQDEGHAPAWESYVTANNVILAEPRPYDTLEKDMPATGYGLSGLPALIYKQRSCRRRNAGRTQA